MVFLLKNKVFSVTNTICETTKNPFNEFTAAKFQGNSLGVLEIIIHTHKKFVDECFSYNENFQEYSLFHLRELMLFFFLGSVWFEWKSGMIENGERIEEI